MRFVYADRDFVQAKCYRCARKGVDIPIPIDEPAEVPYVCDKCGLPIGNPLSREALSHLAWEIYHAKREGIFSKDKTLKKLARTYSITQKNVASLAYP